MHAGNTADNHVTLTFDLYTSMSMHVEQLPYTVCLRKFGVDSSSLFLLEHGHTERRSQHATDRPTHSSAELPAV